MQDNGVKIALKLDKIIAKKGAIRHKKTALYSLGEFTQSTIDTVTTKPDKLKSRYLKCKNKTHLRSFSDHYKINQLPQRWAFASIE